MEQDTRRRGMNPVLAFLLGFLFGIIVLTGAVVGAVYFALTYKIDKIVANKDGDGNYIYVNADPESGGAENVLDLVKKITEIAKDTSSLTIEKVEGILPVTNKLTDALQSAVGQYVELDVDELKQTTFSQLGSYLQNTIMEIRPATLLDKFGGSLAGNVFIDAILYDSEGEPVTLRTLTSGDILSGLYEKEVLELFETNDTVAHKILDGVTVGDLVNGTVNLMDELALADLITVKAPTSADRNTILIFLAYSASDITEEIGEGYSFTGVYRPTDGEAEKCYIFSDENEVTDVCVLRDGEFVSVERTVFSGVNAQVTRINSTIKIKDIVPISEDNTVMNAIGESTINSLADDIENLAINELYYDSIYASSNDASGEKVERYLVVSEQSLYVAREFVDGCVYYFYEDGKYVTASTTGKLGSFEEDKVYYTAGEGRILFDTAYLYYTQTEDGRFVMVDGGGKVSEFEDGVYYTYGAANATWKLLVYSDGGETAYSVNGLTGLIDNVTVNVQKTTMRELDEAGVVDMGANLDKQLTWIAREDGQTHTSAIGALTLKELLDVIVIISDTLPA